ncbi:MAG: hypothetical protein FWD37_00105 [Methanomassiliicoccaceae archaeon]|nr:hypothetical protein [Methanomassiliicoccaceae archaeon]
MGKVNILGVIGGALAAVSVFLTWIVIGPIEITGWEIFDNSTGYEVYYLLIPMIVLVLGGVAILLSLLGVRGITGMIGSSLLTLPIIFILLFLEDVGALEFMEIMDIIDLMGIGAFMCIASGVVLMISRYVGGKK